MSSHKRLYCTYALTSDRVRDLPGFPFTVILPIYDILDLYSFIELKSQMCTGK